MDWSQAELAKKIDADQAQISAYERSENLPSVGMIKRLAGIFNVTTDYLLFDENEEKASVKIRNKELLQLFEELEKLNDEDKNILIGVMKIAIAKNRMQMAAHFGSAQ